MMPSAVLAKSRFGVTPALTLIGNCVSSQRFSKTEKFKIKIFKIFKILLIRLIPERLTSFLIRNM